MAECTGWSADRQHASARLLQQAQSANTVPTVYSLIVLRVWFQTHSSYFIILCPSHPRMSSTCANGHTRLSLVGARGVVAEKRAKSLHMMHLCTCPPLFSAQQKYPREYRGRPCEAASVGVWGRAFESPPSAMTQAGADTHGLPRHRSQCAHALLWRGSEYQALLLEGLYEL